MKNEFARYIKLFIFIICLYSYFLDYIYNIQMYRRCRQRLNIHVHVQLNMF